MFNTLPQLPPDPILGLIAQFKSDPRPHKIDLGVGVYRDEQGQTPVLDAVKQAEQRLLNNETSKAYVGPLGSLQFNDLLAKLTLGETHSQLENVALVQTPGGCGALRVAAELIVRTSPKSRIWVSDPTWGNHVPLLGDAGVTLETYPYYDFATHSVRFDEMISALNANARAGDFVLLHGCCHNPTGADLTQGQWQAVTDLCSKKGLIPFIDMAYQGFGFSLEEDAFGIRLMCDQLPEVLFVLSCSKNFGLYRERVGAVAVKSDAKASVSSHIATIVRGIYSMPPSHGASVVAEILADSVLRKCWEADVSVMRTRIQVMRKKLVDTVNTAGAEGRFNHIARQQGMFSFLGISPEQVNALAENHAVFMIGSSRISLAGLNDTNLPVFAQALLKI